MIYISFGSLIFLALLLAFIIHRLLSKMSELEDKLMSRDFQHFAAVRKQLAVAQLPKSKKAADPLHKPLPPDETGDPFIGNQ